MESFNIDKWYTLSIIRIKSPVVIDYIMDNEILERREVKDLGVTYNSVFLLLIMLKLSLNLLIGNWERKYSLYQYKNHYIAL